jgi:hypothetical protein
MLFLMQQLVVVVVVVYSLLCWSAQIAIDEHSELQQRSQPLTSVHTTGLAYMSSTTYSTGQYSTYTFASSAQT